MTSPHVDTVSQLSGDVGNCGRTPSLVRPLFYSETGAALPPRPAPAIRVAGATAAQAGANNIAAGAVLAGVSTGGAAVGCDAPPSSLNSPGASALGAF